MNDHWGGRFWNIDLCIAPLVQMLLELKVNLIQACCGHGEKPIRIWFTNGPDRAAYRTILKLHPDRISPIERLGTATAEWKIIPREAMAAMGMHYHGDGTIKDRPCTEMFIDEGRHPTWFHDMPVHTYHLVQMLRQLGVHTTNSATPPGPAGICLWFNRGVDNAAYETVKKLHPDEITPPEHQANHVATWYASPIPGLLAEQGVIPGYS
jgi:hypothetical protein